MHGNEAAVTHVIFGDGAEAHEVALSDAKRQFGDARAVHTVEGWVVLRHPKKAEHDRWMAMLFSDKEKPRSSEYIVRALRVFPAPEAFEAMLERKPGLPLACMEAVNELMGIAGTAEVKS